VNGIDIVLKAREMLGVRYRHQGRSREGVDCIGLPALVRAELGLETIDVTDYPRRATDESMRDWCRDHMVAVDEIQPGDILVMAFGTDRHMCIVGDYPHGGHSIIHAYIDNRRVVENRLDEAFAARVIGRFRFPEVAA
jgi:cell wall-associated NlpC family hydrolase